MPSRSSVSRVPAYRLHKPSGQARVIIGGRQVYLGRYGSPESREKYSHLIAEHAASPATPPRVQRADGKPPRRLVIEILAGYLNHAEAYYRKNGEPSGWLVHIRLVLRLVRELYGSLPADEFGPLSMKAVRSRLVEAGHSRGYINKLVAIVPRIFKWAASEELVSASVYHALRTVEGLRKGRTIAPDRPPVLPVADAVVEATLPYLPTIVADMVRLQRFTGMRPGEVVQVRPMDVDRSGDVWLYRPESHKTEHHGRERVIFIGPRAQEVLRPYLLRAADAYCFSPIEAVADFLAEKQAARVTPIGCGNRPGSNRKHRPKRSPGDHYTADSYRRAIARGVVKANEAGAGNAADRGEEPTTVLRDWHPNQLRHSAATEIRKACGLEAAQVVLGHAKADVTRVYAERDQAVGKAVAQKIG